MLTIHMRMWHVLTLALLFSTLACRAATSLILPDTPTPPPTLTATFTPVPVVPIVTSTIITEVTQEAFCPSLLSDILAAARAPGKAEDAKKERYLVTYTVSDDVISDPYYETVPADFKDAQEDTVTQRQIWQYFTALIPVEQRGFLAEYSVITDGEDNILAAVAQTYDDPTRWALEVDIADSSDYYNLTFTFLHEFGHLLTLNANQVPPSTTVFNNPDDDGIYQHEVSLCPNYFPGEGCSKPDSYINAFYQRFWPGIFDEWSAIEQITDEDVYYEQLDEFYSKYQDQFVSDYAASHPAEDITESWSHFVLEPAPQGETIAEQKVRFFYQYPELVELREEILSNLCTSFPQ